MAQEALAVEDFRARRRASDVQAAELHADNFTADRAVAGLRLGDTRWLWDARRAPGVLVVSIQVAALPVGGGHPGAEGVCLVFRNHRGEQASFVRQCDEGDFVLGGTVGDIEKPAEQICIQRQVGHVAVLLGGEPLLEAVLPGLSGSGCLRTCWEHRRRFHRHRDFIAPFTLVLRHDQAACQDKGGDRCEDGGTAETADKALGFDVADVLQGFGKIRGGGEAPGQVGFTGLADDAVEVEPEGPFLVGEIVRHFGEFHAVLPAAHLIEHLAQAVDVRLRRAGAFRGHKAFGAHKGALPKGGHEADVRQLADAADEDDVGGLDVTVREAVVVHVVQGIGHVHARIPAEEGVQPAVALHVRGQRARHVGLHVADVRAVLGIVRQLHHAVVKAALLIPADVQDVHEAGMPARDRLELLDALKLAVEGAGEFKVLTPDDLHGTQRARDALSQPHFAIGPGADALEQRVVGNDDVIPVGRRAVFVAALDLVPRRRYGDGRGGQG